jgi:hypothetical protein
MAGVKTKKTEAGKSMPTRWKRAMCSVCAREIDGLKDAYRVQSISYGPRRDLMVWQHRSCHASK